jgi:tetratricopeptide (TPR) repeat protein
MFKRALAIFDKALGPEHPFASTSLNNLAELYRKQNRYAEAEPLLERSLAIAEKTLGPEHPTVGIVLNDLAELYRAQGRNVEAEPLKKRALAIREKALGPEVGRQQPEAAPVVTSSTAGPTPVLPAPPKGPKKAPKAPDWRTEVWR